MDKVFWIFTNVDTNSLNDRVLSNIFIFTMKANFLDLIQLSCYFQVNYWCKLLWIHIPLTIQHQGSHNGCLAVSSKSFRRDIDKEKTERKRRQTNTIYAFYTNKLYLSTIIIIILIINNIFPKINSSSSFFFLNFGNLNSIHQPCAMTVSSLSLPFSPLFWNSLFKL